VRVWDSSTGEVQNVLEGHTEFSLSVAFSPDGKRIVSGSKDKSVRVWDSSTGEVQNVLEGHTNWSLVSRIFT
jgi:WD40 repeat protein